MNYAQFYAMYDKLENAAVRKLPRGYYAGRIDFEHDRVRVQNKDHQGDVDGETVLTLEEIEQCLNS